MTIALITGLISDVTNFLFGLASVEKEGFKALLAEWHLLYFWDSARTILDVPFVLGLTGALLMERFAGRIRSSTFSASFWQGVWFQVLNIAILGVVLGSALRLIHQGYDAYFPFLGVRVLSGYSPLTQLAGLLVIGDFIGYVRHKMMHKVPILWVFHAVHHSDSEVGPTTEYRSHIGEKIAGSLISTGPMMILGADPAVVLVIVVFGEFWALFVHSSARITLGPIGRFVSNPCFHRLHHSKDPRHWDRNYGAYFTVWDRIFGTACMDFDADFETGISKYGRANPTSSSVRECIANWAWLTVRPFLDIARGGWRTRSPEIYGCETRAEPDAAATHDAAVYR